MFLSIIVPVYNAERYLGECLDSLLAQDISDYEILCVNDGSTDGSLTVLERYAQAHPNIIIISKENGGVTTARNAGLAQASGDYIWFLDSDDLIRENCLGKLKELSQGQDRVMFGAYQFTDALTNEELTLAAACQLTTNTSFYDSVVWRSILRREFLLQHCLNFRYPELTHGEDGLFMYEVTLCSPKSVVIEDVLYFYRLHSGSAEAAATPEKQLRRLRSLIRVCDILHSYYQQHARDSSNRLMSFLWMTLYDITRAPKAVETEALHLLTEAHLFPFEKPEDCTIRESYLMGGFPGKVFDKLYLNLHKPWAYKVMRLLQSIRK